MATISKENYDRLPGGKLKGFVVCKLGDKYIVKSKPRKSETPPTKAQLENRKRFAELMRKR